VAWPYLSDKVKHMSKILGALLLINSLAFATDPYVRNAAIDVQQYIFQIEVNDSTDVISGRADVIILFKKPVQEFELDLINKDNLGKGMEVAGVSLKGASLVFTHKSNRLRIVMPSMMKANDQATITIVYKGIPQDGLVIGKNKFGDRGFFGDNWPDRGHHWLPVVDHPSDKAAVDFIIIAPLHYAVIANGIKIEESPLDTKRKLTHWHEEVPIPVKVMVAGIARFAIQYVGKVNDIPVESWVFPQNKTEGFYDYAVAVKMLDYFNGHIGSYSYKKLANVQSKTRWGGMENASAIFYPEGSVNGKADDEGTIAHEIAHQWFGDSASENDWYHVWLSEGFATYFSNLYLEYAYGHDRLVKEEKIDREEVIAYFLEKPAPVVDTTITNISDVLSVNTYQKGGWAIHMLRHEMGEIDFWKGIRQYYATYKNKNVMTADFQRVMEQASGKDLSIFFNQWLFKAGHPKISGSWHFDGKSKTVNVEIEQIQPGVPFKFSLDFGIVGADGRQELTTAQINSKSQKFTFSTSLIPTNLILDPETWLLFEGSLKQK